jgi:predicted transposase/invertase (TIGR01784 family)
MEEQKRERYVNPYTESLKQYRDMRNVVNSAERRGKAEGREEGIQNEKIDTAHRLKAMGLTMEQIAQGTNLTVDEVKNILSSQ